jgi:hypothetical protein
MRAVVIANIGPRDWSVNRTYSRYYIPPAQGEPGEPGFRPGLLTVNDAKDRIDLGEQKYHWTDIQAADIAADLVKADNLSVHGVFVCAGMAPTDAEIQAAWKLVKQYLGRKLAEADGEFARYHRHEFIEDDARRACKVLGVEREWAVDLVERVACPVCGTKNGLHVAKCNCGAILDIDVCLGYGLLDVEAAARMKAMRASGQIKTPTVEKVPARGTGGRFASGTSKGAARTGRELKKQAGDFSATDDETAADVAEAVAGSK